MHLGRYHVRRQSCPEGRQVAAVTCDHDSVRDVGVQQRRVRSWGLRVQQSLQFPPSIEPADRAHSVAFSCFS